jgi:hypothetical protein
VTAGSNFKSVICAADIIVTPTTKSKRKRMPNERAEILIIVNIGFILSVSCQTTDGGREASPSSFHQTMPALFKYMAHHLSRRQAQQLSLEV